MLNNLKRKVYTLFKQADIKDLLKGGSKVFFIRILGLVLGYLFTLIITRTMGSEDWGEFTLTFIVLQLFSILTRLGFDLAGLRFFSIFFSNREMGKVKDLYKKILIGMIMSSIIGTIMIVLSANVISEYLFNKPNLKDSIVVIGFGILPFNLILLHGELLRSIRKIIHYALLVFCVQYLLSIIILIAVQYSLIVLPNYGSSVTWVYLISILATSIMIIIIGLRNIDYFNVEANHSLTYKTLFVTSLPMMITNSTNLLMNWLSTILVGYYLLEQDVGIYNVAFKLSMLTGLSLQAVNAVSAPKFAAYYGVGNYDGLEKVIHDSTKLIFWISLPIILVFFIFPSFILGVFGEEFQVGVAVLIILTIGNFVNAISGSVGYLLQMTGYEKVMRNIMFITLLLNTLLCLLLIPRLGIVGAAISSCCSNIFWNIIAVVVIKKKFNILTIYIPFIKKIR